MGWCGAYDRHLWRHSTLSPCIFASVFDSAFALWALAVLALQLRQVLVLSRHAYLDKRGRKPLAEHARAACYALLAASHLGVLVFLATGGRGAASFQYYGEAVLLATWAALVALLALASARGLTLQLRLVAWPAAVLYAWALYTDALMLAGHWGYPHRQLPVLLGVAVGQLVVLLAAGTLEALRPPSPAEDEAVKEGLLAEARREGPQGNAAARGFGSLGRGRKRPWYSLILTAVWYVWPKRGWLQVQASACVVCLAVMRLLNLAVPILYRDVVNLFSQLSEKTHPLDAAAPQTFTFWQAFWNGGHPYLLLYLCAAFLQGGPGTGSMGLMNNLRQFLWVPIMQAAYRSISLDLFAHVLDLDLRFHLLRKTGEVTRVMDRGTASIQNILSTVLFSIVPQLFDIVAACVFMAAALEPWIAAIVGVTLLSYIPMTIYVTEWRAHFRRDLNKYDNLKSARVTDAMLNYETVKYFNNEGLEGGRFADAIRLYQRVEYQSMASLYALNVSQSAIIFTGLVTGLCFCAQGVASGALTVGDAVLFITLMQQLYTPLNYFGSYYRTIQTQMIDIENCVDLLAANATIKDAPGAAELAVGEGAVAFEDVSFSYSPDSPVLQRVSFSCKGGQTLALVGATGSGKSSALRLLFRFYDPSSGRVLVDGQDVAKVTQQSLRSAMAVVPQDTVLFNDTIMYNIRYGRPGVSDEEVMAAAEAASLHETITTRFPQGYDTVVGERGLRLSGGEKQRVAFARAILKNPRILLLDEATSALDTLTEQRIQGALRSARANRTSVIVAHRLSTIMDADVIVCLAEGRVAEMGRHGELLQRKGLYSQMWRRQAESALAGTPEGELPPSIAPKIVEEGKASP